MSLNKNNKSFFLALISCISGFTQAVEEKKDSIRSEKLDEVVITATRTKRLLSSLPMPVQLISKIDFNNDHCVCQIF